MEQRRRRKKVLSQETESLLSDIKDNYLHGRCSIKDLSLKYSMRVGKISKYIEEVMKNMAEERKYKEEKFNKLYDTEEEIAKYGVPEKYKFKKQ